MSTKTLAPSVVTDRDPKGMKFMAICAAAYNRAGLSQEEAQRVNETPGLSGLVDRYIAENRVPNEFKGEEVPSKYGYLSGYKKPDEVYIQCKLLHVFFPDLGSAPAGTEDSRIVHQFGLGNIAGIPLAEGWFAIPNWMKNPQIFGKTYAEAVQKVLDMIKEARGRLYNYREGSIDEAHLRQSARSLEAWKNIAEEQGNPDILIVAGQFGLRHRGRSVRRALAVMPKQGEFGFGAFAVGCMFLVHPNRLQNYDDLWIDCSGDEWSPDGDGKFSLAPYFGFRDDGVEFDACGVSNAGGYCGSASGFFPQS
ncbi:MAG: hypothetical protein WC631_03405 [Candidatus Paceibacterota bacterium]|jgi:hypothetical protein